MTKTEKHILTYSAIAIAIGGLYIVYKKNNAVTPIPFLNNKLNKDGSAKVTTISQSGTPSTVVDKAGDYIETTDNTTLYNNAGDVVGTLNTSYGMFVDSQGNIIAASDGTPVIVNISKGTYTEPDGTIYNMDGSVNTPSPISKTSHWYDNFFNWI